MSSLRQQESGEGLGALAKGPAGPDGAGGGRRRFVLQMVEEIPGENHCNGLTRESHWDSCSHSHPSREDGYTHTCTYTYTQRHTQGKDSPSRHASPQTDQPSLAHSPRGMQHVKNSSPTPAHPPRNIYPPSVFQMPMASPQTLLLCLLLLAVTEGQSRQAAIPGCYLHRK